MAQMDVNIKTKHLEKPAKCIIFQADRGMGGFMPIIGPA
jgi:hypothetical protein